MKGLFRPLNTTKRCELFNELSNIIWDEISDYHRLGCDSHEAGITKYLLREFNRFSIDVIRNFQLYAKPGYRESVYGSDIDVYLGIGAGKYRWFALQAKLLKKDRKYTTMRDGHSKKNPSYQWEKLTLLEAVSACSSYYLFYNGSAGTFTHSANDRCGKHLSERDFGCSIVEARKIKTDMEMRMKSAVFHNPTFLDYHPSIAAPWRTLVCCPHSEIRDGFLPYYREDIERSVEGYVRLNPYLEPGALEDQIIADQERQFVIEELQISKKARPKDFPSIADASEKAGWSPEYKIIINTTKDS